MSATSYKSEPVAVLPTSTVLGTVDVRDTRLVAIAVKNADATQTLTVTVHKRAHLSDDFAPAGTFEELTDIPAGETRSIDYDCGTQMELEVRGVGGIMEVLGATNAASTTAANMGPCTGVASTTETVPVHIRCSVVTSGAGDLELWMGSEAAVNVTTEANSFVVVTTIP